MTSPAPLALTTLGGPTVVIELGNTRFLIDPTFDDAGDYPVGTRVLTKTSPRRSPRMRSARSTPSCSRTISIPTTSTGADARSLRRPLSS